MASSGVAGVSHALSARLLQIVASLALRGEAAMKTALGVLVGLALVSLSACDSGDLSGSLDGHPSSWQEWSAPGEPCPDFQELEAYDPWDDAADDVPVMCGGDAFEMLDEGVAWREIPESEPCPDTTCVSIEIVTQWSCPGVTLFFSEELTWRDPGPAHEYGDVTNAKPGVRYTLHYVSDREVVSPRPEGAECWWPI